MAFGSSDETLQIVIKARDDASRVLKDFKGKVESMKPTFQKMAVAGTAAFVGLGAAMKSAIDDGVTSKSIDMAFQRMTSVANIEGDKLIAKLNEISKGTVSTTDLMLASNKAMSLGVGKDMETMTKLMEIARVKGQNMGLTTTQAFNDIVTGIGRGSPLILDNLGINIKLAAAQEQYAASLGKTAAELTEAESSQALLNAVLQSGTAELEALGEVALTPTERMQQLNKQFADMKSQIGEALIPVAEKLAEILVPIIEKIAAWAKENPKLTATIIAGSVAFAGLVAVVGMLGLVLPAVIAGFALLASPVAIIIGLLGVIGLTIAYIATNWSTHMDNIKWAIGIAAEWISEKVEAVKSVLSGWGTQLAELGQSVMSFVGLAKQGFQDFANFFIGIAEGIANTWVKMVNTIIKALNTIQISIPDWVPKYGGRSFGIDLPEVPEVSLPRFEHGGLINAPRGTAVPIMAHGQERIIPAGHSSGGYGSSQNVTININNPKLTTFDDIRLVKRQMEQAYRSVVRDQKLETI